MILLWLPVIGVLKFLHIFNPTNVFPEHHPSHNALLNNLTFLPRFVSNWLHFTHVHNYYALLGYIGHVHFFCWDKRIEILVLCFFTIVLFYSELLVSFLILYQFLNSSFDIKIAGYTGGISL